MKSLSEVCDIVGVTRRTLQEYNACGLLQPTTKTEGGYWLYDDNAIQKLTLIHIFREAGYKRNAIKDILSTPVNLYSSLDKLLVELEDRRARFNGMINTVKLLKQSERLPDPIGTLLASLNLDDMLTEKSFRMSFDQAVIDMSKVEDFDESNKATPMYMLLMLIAYMRHYSASTEAVQAGVISLYRYFCSEYLGDDTRSMLEQADPEKASKIVGNVIVEHFLDESFCKSIDDSIGPEASGFIKDAINVFNNTIAANNDKEG